VSDGTAGGEPTALKAAVAEIEAHVAASGWDQPSRLFALVDTAAVIAREPALAGQMGLDADAAPLTPVEQEVLPRDAPLEETLRQIAWPDEVVGCAAVVERLVLPPEAELPDEATALATYAEAHPDRQDVRIVAGVTRAGGRSCALRLRAHDEDGSVLRGPDLVPALLDLLQGTLEPVDDG
jgi:hypothetical protein